MMNINIEDAYAEACRALGEGQITLRLLGAEVQRLTAENEALKQPRSVEDVNDDDCLIALRDPDDGRLVLALTPDLGCMYGPAFTSEKKENFGRWLTEFCRQRTQQVAPTA